MSTPYGEMCELLAGHGLRLHKATPREAGHLLLDLRRTDGSMLAGQWFADRTRARRVAAATRKGPHGRGVRLIEGSGVVLQPDGADRLLPALSGLVATTGSSLVAHRPERRGVVRQRGRDGRVSYAKAVRRDRLRDLLARARTPEVPGLGRARVIAVDRLGATVSTQSLPGRLFHDLLGDSRVPTASLAGAARAVGAAVARLHATATPAPRKIAHHDATAELSTTLRWWAQASQYDLLDLDGPISRDGFAAARRLLDGPPGPSTFLHRDLHDRQLLVTSGGQVGMLDFDLASTGEAALDLANLLVHMELRALQGHCSWERTRACATAFLRGYQPDPTVARRIPGYTLTTRLRLAAVYSFRPTSSHAARQLVTIGLDALRRPQTPVNLRIAVIGTGYLGATDAACEQSASRHRQQPGGALFRRVGRAKPAVCYSQ